MNEKYLKERKCNKYLVAKRIMKNKKLVTLLSVCLAMGLVACGNNNSSKDVSSQPAPSSETPSVETSSKTPVSSQGGGASSQGGASSSVAPTPAKDKTGHIWGADADVAGDEANGLAAYKRAVCSEGDNAVKYAINQSVVVLAEGSSRKAGTPDGYAKLNKDGNSLSFKFKSDKFLVGKMYLYGCMDAYHSNLDKTFCYYNGSPNIEVKVNGQVVDVSAQSAVTYRDIYGSEYERSDADLSDDNYALLGDVVIQKGVNEITYKRVQTMNTLVKDFVFVGEEIDQEWGKAETVAAAGEGYVGYTKTACLLDSTKTKIEIAALDGTFASGSTNKTGTEDGYLKLTSNGNSISYKFKTNKAAVGELYQVGFMDSFSSNTQKTYANTSTSSNATTFEGNFRVTINDNIVDKSAYMNINFEEMTKDGDNTLFEESKNYSPVALCPIGKVVLKNGDNVLKYERLASYNLSVSSLVLVIRENATDYVVEEALSHDDATHFNKVTGTDVIFNRVEHEWVADETQQDTPSTCTTHGAKHVKCACGATSTQELPLGEHAFAEGTPVAGYTPCECGDCHAKAYVLDVTKASGFNAPGKMKADATWDITGMEAGTYELNVLCYIDNDGNRSAQGFATGENRYQWKVDDGDYVNPSTGTNTYADVNVGKADKTYLWTTTVATVTVGASAASLVMHWNGSGYSLYVSAIRLIKVAA